MPREEANVPCRERRVPIDLFAPRFRSGPSHVTIAGYPIHL